VSFLNPLYHAVAFLLTGIHSGLTHVISNEGWSWALSIVLLTMAMRLLLFPVFVKQIKNQRAMQVLQPKMKELQAKYKNDKEKLNQEMMALWKEHNANPLAGCLPLLLQIPIFISLFHTLREIKPLAHCPTGTTAADAACYPHTIAGFSQDQIASAANARIFHAPIAASFKTASTFFTQVGGSHSATQALCLILTVLMGATTFITQRQLMAQNAASGANNPMAQQQKILLYVFPLVFLVYGFFFPVGVLLYWLTTNVWSMAQQRVIIRRMEALPAPEVATAAGPAPGAKPTPGSKPQPGAKPTVAGGKPKSSSADITLPPGGAIAPGATRPNPSKPSTNARRPSNSRSKNRKKGRR
jgi:YidC/Oxa1 family membrane protein insertase